jgi:hypothetical protein
MKRIGLLLMFLITSMVPTVVLAQSYKDCKISTSGIAHLTIAELRARLVAPTWPALPPGARIEGYAVFQVKVSSQGQVSCVVPINGHPLLVSVLRPKIEGWKFRPGSSFVGVIVVRCSSEGFQLL